MIRATFLLALLAVCTLPRPAIALAIGFFLWVSLYITMPRPIRTYVLAHELTHALWAWLMGAHVSGMSLSKKGGMESTHTHY